MKKLILWYIGKVEFIGEESGKVANALSWWNPFKWWFLFLGWAAGFVLMCLFPRCSLSLLHALKQNFDGG